MADFSEYNFPGFNIKFGQVAGGDLTGTYPNPTIATLSGVTVTFSVLDTSAGVPTAAGTGYVLNDVITLANSVQVIVTNVSGTTITGFAVGQRGTPVSTIPTQPQAQVSTTGVGTGATFTLTYGPVASNIAFADFNQGGASINGATVLGSGSGRGLSNVGLGPTVFGFRALGYGANNGDGLGTSTGSSSGENTAIGYQTMTQITTGGNNTALGHHAGGHETTGNNNTWIGQDAGKKSNGSTGVTVVGANAGKFLQNSSNLVIVGLTALGGNEIDSDVSAVADNGSGKVRLTVTSTAGMTTSTGRLAVLGTYGTTGITTNSPYTTFTIVDATHIDLTTVAVGSLTVSGGSVAAFPATPTNTVAIGHAALTSTGMLNATNIVAVGESAGSAVTSGSALVLIGSSVATGITSASNAVIIGSSAGQTLATGTSGNVIIGNSANVNSATTSLAVAIGGQDSGQSAVASSGSVVVGAKAGNTSDGGNSVVIGVQAFNSALSTGARGVYIGRIAGQGVVTGNDNVMVGASAGGTTVTGGQNTLLGGGAGSANLTTGGGNVIIGYNAKTTGNNNKSVIIGSNDAGGGAGAAGANQSVVIGGKAGNANITGANNTIIGFTIAGTTLTSGNNDILIGTNANVDVGTNSDAHAIVIGTQASLTSAGSNTINIENIWKATGTDVPSTSVSTIAGNLVTSGYNRLLTATTLSAAGTTRTDAFQLAAQINNVTTAAASTGVILPASATVGIGGIVYVFNNGASVMKVYGAGSDTIDGTAGSAGVSLTNAKRCMYFVTAANTFISAQMGVTSA